MLESRMSKKPSQIVQVKVRMREDLRRKIEHAAQKNGLTVNAEILRRLDQTFDVTLDKLEGSVAKLSRFEGGLEEVRVKMEQIIRGQLELQRRFKFGEKDQGDQS
jgi:Arc-like DNA binding domain